MMSILEQSPEQYLSSILQITDKTARSGQMFRSTYYQLMNLKNQYPYLSLNSICKYDAVGVTIRESAFRISNLIHVVYNASSYSMHGGCIAILYAVLLQLPGTSSIYLKGKPKINNRYAKQTTQTGSPGGGSPFHAAGLDGTGQLVGLCDTGIDLYSCFFAETSGSPVCNRIVIYICIP